MIYPPDLRRIIREACGTLGERYATPAAVELLMLTAAKESRLGTYLYQLSGGPALGVFQMEPETHADLWRNHLRTRRAPAIRLADLMGEGCGVESQWTSSLPRDYMEDAIIPSGEDALPSNLAYAAGACRLQYWRAPESLPAADDVPGLAGYWHRHWCRGCRGTVEQAVKAYRELAGRAG